jgi:hypothetical protein
MKTQFTLALLAAAAFAPSLSQAQQAAAPAPSPFRGLIGFAYTSGGDSLATAVYEGGSSKTIKAGGSANFYGGFEFSFKDLPVNLQATIGWHYDRTAASNGNIVFARYPLEALAMYRANESIRLGAGLRYATSPSLSGSGAVSNIGTTEFDPSVGTILKAEYLFSGGYGVELRSVNEHYKVKGNGNSVDGSHFGIGINVYF